MRVMSMRNLHDIPCAVIPDDVTPIQVYIRRSRVIHSTIAGHMPRIPRPYRPGGMPNGLFDTRHCPTPYCHLLANF
jgi:hypothetical protein